MNCSIFLSYGHDEHVGVARRLKADLERRGHEVWFDEEQLKVGKDWEERIEKGIDWTVSEPACGRIVLLMTPHSVRRPDGFCLNELARALSRGLRVVPIMLVWAEPPLSICRIQYLDLRDCIPIEARAATYENRFERLVQAIENDEIDFEGVQTRLLTLLDPLPFDVEISHFLRRFVGREWIFRKVKDWLADPQAERIFWIVGAPGMGKTALSAKLAATHREVVAVHLCQAGHAQKSDARRCVMSIAYQLSTQLPEYEERLNSLALHTIIRESDAQTLFDRLILQPLSAEFPDPGRMLVVLIDALDEATRDGRNPLAALLANGFSKTPPWLRLIITSRPAPEVKFALQAVTAQAIGAASSDNEVDLRAFLTRELRTPLANVANPAAVVDGIVERSEGNFLYVEWLRREVMAGNISLVDPAGLPRGLGGVYSQFVTRQWPDVDAFRREIGPALDMIAAAREPLSLAMLAEICGWSERQRNDFELALGSLFTVSAGRVVVFHKSLLDWLTDREKAGPYFVAAADGSGRLTDYCWREFGAAPSVLSEYALGHLPAHLIADERWDALENVLTCLGYLEAKVERLGVFALVADFVDAGAALPPTRPLGKTLQLIEQAMRREQHFIGRHPTTLFQCLWNLCWWYGSPEAAHHYAPTADAAANGVGSEAIRLTGRLYNALFGRSKGSDASSGGAPTLRALMDRWRVEKAARQPEAIWVRSLRPPVLPLSAAHMVLGGHGSDIGEVAVTADGTRLVSGSGDGTLRLWDTHTGAELLVCRAPEETRYLPRVAITADGRLLTLLLAGSRAVTLWDAETGKVLRQLGPYTADLRCVAFSPDGRRLAAGASDAHAIVWDVDSGEQLALLHDESSAEIARVAFSQRDGALLLTGGHPVKDQDQYAGLWDWQTGRRLRQAVMSINGSTPSPVRFSPDGTRFAAGTRDFLSSSHIVDGVKIWMVEGTSEPILLKDRGNIITDVGFSPDGTKLVSCGWNGSIRLWDIASATHLVEVKLGTTSILAGYLADGRVYSTDGNVIRIWDNFPAISPPPRRRGSESVDLLVYSPDGKYLARAARPGCDLWDAKTGRCVGDFCPPKAVIVAMVFSPDGRQLAVITKAVPQFYDANASMGEQLSPFHIRVFDVASQRMLGGLNSGIVYNEVPQELRYSTDGRTLFALFDGEKEIIALSGRRFDKVEKLTGERAATTRAQLGPRIETDLGRIEVRQQGAEMVFIDRQNGREIAWLPLPLHELVAHPAGRMWAGLLNDSFEMVALEGMP
jgi:WD40 repeat protein